MRVRLQQSFLVLACLMLASVGVIWKWRISASRFSDYRTVTPVEPIQTDRLKVVANSSLRWTEQVNALSKLEGPLSPEEQEFLFKELRHTRKDENPERQWVVQNEIMEVLREKGLAPDRYALELVAIVRDPGVSEVTRDYAVQHLALWLFPMLPKSPRELDMQRRIEGLNAIVDTVLDARLTGPTIQGTSLNVLVEITPRLPAEEAERLWNRLESHLATFIAGQAGDDVSRRSAVIRIAGTRRLQVAYPDIRQMAMDTSHHPMLRLSAVAALGNYGKEQDRALLVELNATPGPVQPAAVTALRKLDTLSR